jgi:BMFP domain-containing protein YqiC
MSQSQKFFEDVTRLMSGALGTADAMRQEFETMLRERFERFCRDMNLVTREDYETLREQVVASRKEQEDLKARIAALEEKLFSHVAPGHSPQQGASHGSTPPHGAE